ncbi:DUF493 domain-containing protein [Maioricimonas sp. JC845]|uniref:YbeD family protein n=1 Tax=Maioricimonas sp. JC845 TaxID=3232138 RepID=UPI0034583211
MDQLPTIELLEATHQFPGRYVFKVIGSSEDRFVGRVVQAVRAELAVDMEPSFSSRSTAGGRHVSVTIEPEVKEAQQVLAIYERLRELDGLVMLF